MLQMHINGCVSWKKAVFQETAGSIMQRIINTAMNDWLLN